jgi:hypothetical protein
MLHAFGLYPTSVRNFTSLIGPFNFFIEIWCAA